ANKKELFDNVIPSSNSMMARNFHQLGIYYYNAKYQEQAKTMLASLHNLVASDTGFMANWANLYLELLVPTAEVAIIGNEAPALARNLRKNYHPNTILAASGVPDENIPLLQGKASGNDGKALIYVCFNKSCQRPVSTIDEAIMQFPNLA
ncbi:MAG TPA: hypothetical protein VKZ51_07565, partial [Cyclobacteriaceae bacterium]|nr:hypothetical protein [Cyclobacteriaceae bacterium]